MATESKDEKKQERFEYLTKRILGAIEEANVLELELPAVFTRIIADRPNPQVSVRVFALLGHMLKESGYPAVKMLQAALEESEERRYSQKEMDAVMLEFSHALATPDDAVAEECWDKACKIAKGEKKKQN